MAQSFLCHSACDGDNFTPQFFGTAGKASEWWLSWQSNEFIVLKVKPIFAGKRQSHLET